MSIHSRNDAVILEFGLHKPAYRICVNTPTTHGSIGLTTGPRPGDDARVRRLRRQHHVGQHLAAPPAEHQAPGVRDPSRRPAIGRARASADAQTGDGRSVPAAASAVGCSPAAARDQPRGADGTDRPVSADPRVQPSGAASPPTPAAAAPGARRPTPTVEKPAAFRLRRRRAPGDEGWDRRCSFPSKTIVTPAARDLGDAHGVFRYAGVSTGPVDRLFLADAAGLIGLTRSGAAC